MSRHIAQVSSLGSKGERTRNSIIDCASQLFYQHGYNVTSFSDIVAASGLFRGNIYHYFHTKDEILKAVIDRHLDQYRALLVRWEQDGSDAKARLHAFVDMITGRRKEVVEFGCPIGSLNSELAKNQRGPQQAARAMFDLFRDWLGARFRELGKTRDAESLALHLLGRAQGIAVMAQVYRDTKLLRRETDLLQAWIDKL